MNSTQLQSNTIQNRQHSFLQQQKRVEKSYEEITIEKQLSNVEQLRFNSVFNYLLTFNNDKIKLPEPEINAETIINELKKVDYLLQIMDAELFIWKSMKMVIKELIIMNFK